LSRLAADLGFSSHSHFTAAFRRHYGNSPAAARAILTRDTRSERREKRQA
jgi:AraC-like DNA-binding protein